MYIFVLKYLNFNLIFILIILIIFLKNGFINPLRLANARWNKILILRVKRYESFYHIL